MAEPTRKSDQAKKAEGAVDPSTLGKEMAASADDNEAQGHTIFQGVIPQAVKSSVEAAADITFVLTTIEQITALISEATE